MWQRFTKRAQRVVFFGQEEAKRLGHRQVDTEHLLLGLFRENEDARAAAKEGMVWPPAPTVHHEKDSLAVRVLRDLGVDEAVLGQTEGQALPGNDVIGDTNDMELTAASKRVIDLMYKEAQQMKNDALGTEHLLLGLIREADGVAGRILAQQGVYLEQARLSVAQWQKGAAPAQVTPAKRQWWASLLGSKQ